VQEESVNRVRPPRYIYQDGIIRPYRLKEAQSLLILEVVYFNNLGYNQARLHQNQLIGYTFTAM
jgi:hypothetical protein